MLVEGTTTHRKSMYLNPLANNNNIYKKHGRSTATYHDETDMYEVILGVVHFILLIFCLLYHKKL